MSKKKHCRDTQSRQGGEEPAEEALAAKPDQGALPAQAGLAALDAEIVSNVFSGKYDREWRKQGRRKSRNKRRK